MIDGVVMQVSVPAAEAGGIPFGEHVYGVVELFPGQFAVWISLPHEVKQSLFGPFFTRDSRDYLLGENIERFLGDNQMVQLAAPGGVNQRGAFDEFVTAVGNNLPFETRRLNGPTCRRAGAKWLLIG